MSRFSLKHLADSTLDAAIESVAARERMGTADLLAHIAESDARKRYVPAGYHSMFAYCQGKLRLCEQAAYKRVTVARAARKFPVIFEVIADGRVHLSGMVLLVPHLTPETVDELIAAATHKTRAQIELLLARRFPRPDVPTRIQPIVSELSRELSPGRVCMTTSEQSADDVARQPESSPQLVPTRVEAPAPPAPPARVKPLAPERFELRATIDQETRELLQQAQNLLGHRVPAGDVPQVLKLALKALVELLEKSKFSATTKPRPVRETSEDSRHIPAHVKRAVWKRDGGQCTFKGPGGHRCEARCDLEFDHVIPVARGGKSDVGNIRLLCRPHNQLEAERTYGPQLMNGRRKTASEGRGAGKTPDAAA